MYGGETDAQVSGTIRSTPTMPLPSSSNFSEEPPLLEGTVMYIIMLCTELGIDFNHISKKTLMVLHPFRPPEPHYLQDTDLAGPLIFALLLGAVLLLVTIHVLIVTIQTGKIHFGYIYGMGVVGCLSTYSLLNLMTEKGVEFAAVVR